MKNSRAMPLSRSLASGNRQPVRVEKRSQGGAGFGLSSRPDRAYQADRRGLLKRLKVEAIDLFCRHRADPEVPVEDAARG